MPVKDRNVRKMGKKLCYYTGSVRNARSSRAALSACDGLIGYVLLDGRMYYIEPVYQHSPNKRGQLMHVLYEKHAPSKEERDLSRCGTNSSWEDAWRDRFRNEFVRRPNRNKPSGLDPYRQRSLESVSRWLETLVVCDKKFIEHHKGTNVQEYVLTIMNMVADFYRDASVGNEMEVVVVRIMYLEKEEEEIDLTINRNAEDTLASFCKWQVSVNPTDISHPNHHDIAVLLTRYDICSDNMKNCALTGLAYVATACTPDKNCAINEDDGLALGIIVAHEMGHVMGCSHDSEAESGCQPTADDGSFFIMSPYVHLHTTIWSSCSRKYITTLFENDLGECLNDEPQETLYKFAEMLPGSVYDANYQCNLHFPGSTVCNVDPEQFCEMLFCRTDPNSCSSNGEPPADGTKCAEHKWCYNMKCIEEGSRPEAINGGWSEWTSWSDCSRSCGGGIQYSERLCNNPAPQHKGRYCLGLRKKTKICNADPCPKDSKPFRAVQCTEHDTIPFNEKLHTWTPFFKEDDPCTLYCLNENNVYSKLEPRVKDGTPCKKGTKNMCVSGACKEVGCDWVLDSKAVEDVCGICKGDGTQCKIVEGVYKDPAGVGYTKVVMIPKGVRNVMVEERVPSENIIALTTADEKTYLLNGGYVEQMDGDYVIGGSDAVYSHPEPDKESLKIYGPLQEDLVLFVCFFNRDNVGYHYKWSEPAVQVSYQPRYHWEYVEWSECSARCGGGVQTSQPTCLEEKAGKVDDSFCDPANKPVAINKKCNEKPCKTKWRVGKWSTCSGCKFRSGIRTREVSCVREAAIAGQEDVLVEDTLCTGPKPCMKELCNSLKPCRKSKRNTDGLPDDLMRNVFHQTSTPQFELRPTGYYLSLFKDFNRRNLRRISGDVKRDSLYFKRLPLLPDSYLHLGPRDSGSNGVEVTYGASKLLDDPYSPLVSTREWKILGDENNATNGNGNEGGSQNLLPYTPLKQYLLTGSPKNVKAEEGSPFALIIKAKDFPLNTDVTVAPLLEENGTTSPICNKTTDAGGSGAPVNVSSKVPATNVSNQTKNQNVQNKGNAQNANENAGKPEVVSKDKLKIGTVALDKVKPEDIKMIKASLKQTNLALNLSDVAFETVGDKVPDSVEISKGNVTTGQQAADLKKECQHGKGANVQP